MNSALKQHVKWNEEAAWKIKDYCCGYPRNLCNKIYRPHCGSDGKTYANQLLIYYENS
uniref:Kazal-like domain-containing protein n=1 Tax=Salvator merianae TaxID=96440 RepID=A0A8D0DWD6_SALMN